MPSLQFFDAGSSLEEVLSTFFSQAGMEAEDEVAAPFLQDAHDQVKCLELGFPLVDVPHGSKCQELIC